MPLYCLVPKQGKAFAVLARWDGVAVRYRGEQFPRLWCVLDCPTCCKRYEGSVAVALGEIGLKRIEADATPKQRRLSAMLNNLSIAYAYHGRKSTLVFGWSWWTQSPSAPLCGILVLLILLSE